MPVTKWILITSLFIPLIAFADGATPYFRISGGVAFSRIGQTQTINFSPTYWKKLVASKDQVSPFVGGVSVGARIPLSEYLETEIGLGYYQLERMIVDGKVYQYGLPSFYNLNYQYSLVNRSLLLESKFLYQYAEIYHPYFIAGMGMSRNLSYDYQEIPLRHYAVPDPAFRRDTQTNFSYALGLGLDIDIASHWRVGAGYQYKLIGYAKLGPSKAQLTSQRIRTGELCVNQWLVEASYTL